MFSSRKRCTLIGSDLYDERSFYAAFERDISKAKHSVIIESPFITMKRLEVFLPIFARLQKRGTKITINTRNPLEHDEYLQAQAEKGISTLQELGVMVLFTGNHHRKVAMIDYRILWEGSLNILSQSDSCEIMRRIDSPELVQQMIRFMGLNKWYS